MHSLNSVEKGQTEVLTENDTGDERKMLAELGYSQKAIKYYIEKPYMGSLQDADQVSEMLGTCGDTLKIFLKVDQGKIKDVRYQVLGCPGAISAAMASVDLVKGKHLEYARNIDDGDVFTQLEDVPAKKHHCIQLAVKALHKAIDEYKNGNGRSENIKCQSICSTPGECCKN
ncbi:MAG: iron-sulfur cluster assembly scaffold protein [Deltaproteobacteria bacterium]|nr:iron-sulfur cluster assembly scaffold protein [Deltaproteobacteria bacterium]MBW1958796.1 iron-sulfur cluster assembly scaffold protein [Deltaproteobacteria bacterium]MBW2014005.1 iron-sulfur cluster assembly scaffold protein [Deltaproteobacteria bacterium]MBW2089825.1 iron-sulfur cluster assembly scaffold protein [Deltaproteobacteria bacterium]MBW2321018.1 iron-sulfur cluster assembly scaffold protein [Deltaproteobacteria bacterium]